MMEAETHHEPEKISRRNLLNLSFLRQPQEVESHRTDTFLSATKIEKKALLQPEGISKRLFIKLSTLLRQ